MNMGNLGKNVTGSRWFFVLFSGKICEIGVSLNVIVKFEKLKICNGNLILELILFYIYSELECINSFGSYEQRN